MSVFGAPIAVPAISRCAHGVPSTKRCRNCAAVIEPPWRPPVFFMSANCESISLSYSGPSGMRQTFSPVSCPTLISRSANSSRSEEHTSELQSRGHLVCRLLLEKKKKKITPTDKQKKKKKKKY